MKIRQANGNDSEVVGMLVYELIAELNAPKPRQNGLRLTGLRFLRSAGFAHKVGTSELPALVKAGCRVAAGRLVQENESLDQHHPGASRHPSSSEEGSSAHSFDFMCKAVLLPVGGHIESPEPETTLSVGNSRFHAARGFSEVAGI